MKVLHRIFGICAACLVVACAREEPAPTSVAEFMEKPYILEAAMVRCSKNRSESRYDAECINARSAVNRLEAAQERTRRANLEAQSERKRQALRRTQEAAAAARRRAQELQRRQEEEEYLGIFESLPEDSTDPSLAPDLPVPSNDAPVESTNQPLEEPVLDAPDSQAEPKMDLGEVAEELKRRQESTEQ